MPPDGHMQSDGSSSGIPPLPSVIHGVLWVDGDTGTRHEEFDSLESREDPSDVERRIYIALDTLEEIISSAEQWVDTKYDRVSAPGYEVTEALHNEITRRVKTEAGISR